MNVRVLLFFFCICILVVSGCGEEKPPLKLSDTLNGTVDEQPVAKYPLLSVAKDFATFWDRGKLSTLPSFFRDGTQGVSTAEFVYLIELGQDIEEITGVAIDTVDASNTVSFVVTTEDGTVTKTTTAVLVDDEWKLLPFYIFEDVSYESRCAEYGRAAKLADCGLALTERNKTGCIQERTYSCYRNIAILREDKDICEDAGFYKKECLESLGEEVPIALQMESCGAYDDIIERNLCYANLATEESNEEACSAIEGEETKFRCYGRVAGLKHDYDLCRYFLQLTGFAGSSYKEALCIWGYVEMSGDSDKCQDIPSNDNVKVGYAKEQCYKLGYPES